MIEEAIEKLILLLQGKAPEPIETEKISNEKDRELAILLNRLFLFVQETNEFILPLSNGKLEDIRVPPARNFFASPFKQLHSHLRHLTWQAEQVAKGDYSQRVDFMGNFSNAFNAMVVSLDQNEKLLKEKIDALEKALSHIDTLEGILPICSNCKRIRPNNADPKKQESWVTIEKYINDKTKVSFSHGFCPDCLKKVYPDSVDDDDDDGQIG